MDRPWSSLESLKVDCPRFGGDVPCIPHKKYGVHYIDEQGHDCIDHEKLTSKILLIKRGAIVERLPPNVDVILPFTPQNLAALQATSFDLIINLDKDRQACDLMGMAMYIALGVNKKIVLFNNIFDRHEFEFYGVGEILEPELDYPCYCSPGCPNNCVQYIYTDRVFRTYQRLLAV